MKGKENLAKGADSAEPTQAIIKLDLLKGYQPDWLLNDLIAGVLIFAVSHPCVGSVCLIGRSPAIQGFYSSLLSMGIYALFGTSRHIIPDSKLRWRLW